MGVSFRCAKAGLNIPTQALIGLFIKLHGFSQNAFSWHHRSLAWTYDRCALRHLCALRTLKNYLGLDLRILYIKKKFFMVFSLSVTFSIFLERWSTVWLALVPCGSTDRSLCALNRDENVWAAHAAPFLQSRV